MELAEIGDFYIDLDTPHQLGERSLPGEPEADKWLLSNNVYSSCRGSQIVDVIASGIYSVFQDAKGGTHAQKMEVKTDELYFLPNNHTQEVVKEITDFWNKTEKFKVAKVKHKRGILFHGPPGTGKTSIINLLTAGLLEAGGLVFYITSNNELLWFIEFGHEHLRKLEPNRPVIAVIEDLDRFMDGGSIESILLNFLDGPDSFDHQVVVATTNRLHELNDLVLRPSRFDWHIPVDLPDEAVSEAYLIHKGLEKEEAAKWAVDLNKLDFSLAELKEMFISVKLLDLDYEVAKEKLSGQKKNGSGPTYKKKSGKLGF